LSDSSFSVTAMNFFLFIIEKDFNSHTLTGVGFFNPPARENSVKKLQQEIKLE